MYVEFASMVINDFKAFRGRHALALNGTGVVYIEGDNRVARSSIAGNGAAKSTIWDALTWCLFARTAQGLRSPDIKPWKVGGKPFVTVLLVVDGVEQLVQRVTSPRNLFTVNGKECADISEILPISFELFINTILLPQGRELFFNKSPKEKMELVAEARGLDRWDTRAVAASKRADLFDGEASEFLDEQRATEASITELGTLLESTQQASKAWNDEAHSRQRASKDQLKGLERELQRKETELGTAVLAEDGALLELRACEKEVDALRADVSAVVGDLRAVKAEMDILVGQSERLELEIANLAKAKTCPTCGQPVKVANIAEHLAHRKKQVSEVSLKIAHKMKLRRAATARGNELQERLIRHNADMALFRADAYAAEDVRKRLAPEVATLKSKVEAAYKIKDEVNPYLAQLTQLMQRKKGLQANLAAVKVDVSLAQQRAEQARYWIKGFKDIKLQLIEEVLQELELVANGMIEEVGLEDWRIKVDIEKESKNGNVQRMINVQISSPESSGPVRWESWSGGEQERLKLIGSLSLSDVLLAQVGVETNLEVLDEPAKYWSSEGVQELCGFLATRAREQEKTIFYIEHNTVQSTHFTEVLRVVKDAKGARIEG
jgi:DNA repair exonuclease SbcCD ATPase subunit